MIVVTEEIKDILIQFFLDDPTSETPKIHPKKKEKRKGALLKELDELIHSYEQLEIGIDLDPYKKAAIELRKLKGTDAYLVFIDSLLRPYE